MMTIIIVQIASALVLSVLIIILYLNIISSRDDVYKTIIRQTKKTITNAPTSDEEIKSFQRTLVNVIEQAASRQKGKKSLIFSDPTKTLKTATIIIIGTSLVAVATVYLLSLSWLFVLGTPITWPVLINLFQKQQNEKSKQLAIEQFPILIDSLINGVRSGSTLEIALSSNLSDMPEPLYFVVKEMEKRITSGDTLAAAAQHVANILDDPDMKFFASFLAIQNNKGGRVSAGLENLKNLLEERVELKMLLNSLTAESRYSALILAIIPLVIIVAYSFINSEGMSAAFESDLGRNIYIITAIWYAIGIFIIRSLSRLE